MAAALVLQTQDNRPPGLVGDWARSRGLTADVLRLDRWERLPVPDGYDVDAFLDAATPAAESAAC